MTDSLWCEVQKLCPTYQDCWECLLSHSSSLHYSLHHPLALSLSLSLCQNSLQAKQQQDCTVLHRVCFGSTHLCVSVFPRHSLPILECYWLVNAVLTLKIDRGMKVKCQSSQDLCFSPFLDLWTFDIWGLMKCFKLGYFATLIYCALTFSLPSSE